MSSGANPLMLFRMTHSLLQTIIRYISLDNYLSFCAAAITFPFHPNCTHFVAVMCCRCSIMNESLSPCNKLFIPSWISHSEHTGQLLGNARSQLRTRKGVKHCNEITFSTQTHDDTLSHHYIYPKM